MLSVTLFEGIVLLAISGVFVVSWWGIRRLVKMSDDGAIMLEKINESLALICERLSKGDMWMEMHEKQDDERHNEVKNAYNMLSSVLIDKKI